MSYHNIILLPRAESDIDFILQYTAEQWGKPQAEKYRDKIFKATQVLQNNPLTGQRSSLNPDKYRVYPFGSHMMIYRVKPDAIHIIRVLHQRMHIGLHLSDI